MTIIYIEIFDMPFLPKTKQKPNTTSADKKKAKQKTLNTKKNAKKTTPTKKTTKKTTKTTTKKNTKKTSKTTKRTVHRNNAKMKGGMSSIFDEGISSQPVRFFSNPEFHNLHEKEENRMRSVWETLGIVEPTSSSVNDTSSSSSWNIHSYADIRDRVQNKLATKSDIVDIRFIYKNWKEEWNIANVDFIVDELLTLWKKTKTKKKK